MKKLALVLCVLLLLSCGLTGCKAAPDVSVFSDWMTDNGFTPGMNEKSFISKVTKYTYLTKYLTPDELFNEDLGAGYSAGSTFWGMNSRQSTKDGVVTVYHYFHVRKNLDNLEFPGGIRIGDSRKECYNKLGLTDKNLNAKGMELGNKTCEISIVSNILVYNENYNWLRFNDKTANVTRTLILKFSGEALVDVGVSVEESYSAT